jgi:quinol monooxygenase YgiN
MAIKVIVELKAKPGRQDELRSLLEHLIATEGPSRPRFMGRTRYEVLDDPDALAEIADWESAEARDAHMQGAAAAASMHRCSNPWPLRSGPRSSARPRNRPRRCNGTHRERQARHYDLPPAG